MSSMPPAAKYSASFSVETVMPRAHGMSRALELALRTWPRDYRDANGDELVDTARELEYWRHGGVLAFVLRDLRRG